MRNLLSKRTIKAPLYGFCLIIALAAFCIAAGCTGQADQTTALETPDTILTSVPAEETTPAEEDLSPGEELSLDTVDIDDVIAVDLIVMEADIQDKNPLAYNYEIMPTYYLGSSNAWGDYEFCGTVPGLNKTNYLGVMFTSTDKESEIGYREWLYSGMKFDIFSGDESVECYNFSFIVKKEDIPEGKTIIMTGTELHRT